MIVQTMYKAWDTLYLSIWVAEKAIEGWEHKEKVREVYVILGTGSQGKNNMASVKASGKISIHDCDYYYSYHSAKESCDEINAWLDDYWYNAL